MPEISRFPTVLPALVCVGFMCGCFQAFVLSSYGSLSVQDVMRSHGKALCIPFVVVFSLAVLSWAHLPNDAVRVVRSMGYGVFTLHGSVLFKRFIELDDRDFRENEWQRKPIGGLSALIAVLITEHALYEVGVLMILADGLGAACTSTIIHRARSGMRRRFAVAQLTADHLPLRMLRFGEGAIALALAGVASFLLFASLLRRDG